MHKRVGGKYPKSRLQQARIKAGLTQEAAAELLDCSTRSVQRYEAGKKPPRWDVLNRMRACYMCEMSDLLPECVPPSRDERHG